MPFAIALAASCIEDVLEMSRSSACVEEATSRMLVIEEENRMIVKVVILKEGAVGHIDE